MSFSSAPVAAEAEGVDQIFMWFSRGKPAISHRCSWGVQLLAVGASKGGCGL